MWIKDLQKIAMHEKKNSQEFTVLPMLAWKRMLNEEKEIAI